MDIQCTYKNNPPEQHFKYSYPTYKTCRISYRNLERIRKYNNRYKETIDEILTRILDHLDEVNRQSYPDPAEGERSW